MKETKSSVDSAIDILCEQEARPSNRPLKPVKDVLDAWDQAESELRALEVQLDMIQAQMKPLTQRLQGFAEQVKPYLNEYENRLVKLRDIVAKVEEIGEKKSHVPQWSKFRDWALNKFGSISAQLRKEAEQFLESVKNITPAHEIVKITRQKNEDVGGFVSQLGRGLLSKVSSIVNEFFAKANEWWHTVNEFEEELLSKAEAL